MNAPLFDLPPRFLLVLTTASALFAGACNFGDTTTATGERGRLDYQVETDYFVDGSLLDVRLVTGHDIFVAVHSALDEGVDPDASIEHRVTGDNGAVRVQQDVGGALDFAVRASSPGSYTVETLVDGQLEDRITLSFDRPTAIDIVGHLRQPGADSFEPIAGDRVSAVEGAQVVFIPVPLDAAGDRLLGSFDHRIEAPEGALVESASVYDFDEEGVGLNLRTSYHLMRPGEVLVRIVDDVNITQGEVTFDVQGESMASSNTGNITDGQ
jgi:hypothetical protein